MVGAVVSNKKIKFSDDDDDTAQMATEHQKSRKVKSKEDSWNGTKKQKLIGSSSDEEDSEAENAKTLQMFEKKINLNEKKANQLLHLKTKYSNEDGRFKIDDRFVDGSDTSEASDSDPESEPESEDGEKGATDKAPRKEKKIVSDESMKKKLKKETQASLDILASITGRSARRPVDPNAPEKKGEKPVLAQKMVNKKHFIFCILSFLYN